MALEETILWPTARATRPRGFPAGAVNAAGFATLYPGFWQTERSGR
jgi:hypothetical protein